MGNRGSGAWRGEPNYTTSCCFPTIRKGVGPKRVLTNIVLTVCLCRTASDA